MTDERMNWINARAYDLWQHWAPHGKDQEHWLQAVAERDLMEQTRASQGYRLLDVWSQTFLNHDTAVGAARSAAQR
ncbi:DUF2934 domain-containing protein [Rhizobium lusitanum]|uniref:DUF2934 domain-containing protein n=1 Tax=Rhizobium lusitanum TaxID=293958 RepID=UPI003916D007